MNRAEVGTFEIDKTRLRNFLRVIRLKIEVSIGLASGDTKIETKMAYKLVHLV